MKDKAMKKVLITCLILASVPTAASAAGTTGVERVWGLCPTAFPGLGFAGHINFLLPCRVPSTPSNA
jgi:hypothetical protein